MASQDTAPAKPAERGANPLGIVIAVGAGAGLLYLLTQQNQQPGCQPPAGGCPAGTTWHTGKCVCVTPEQCQPPAGGCPAGTTWDQATCACKAGPPPPAEHVLQWSTAASLPNPRNYLAVAASSTRLYAVGGLQDGNPGFTPYVDEYNPATNGWARLPDMPVGRIAHGAAVVGNYLYVLSGFTDPGWNAQDPNCIRMNLATKAGWERIADLPMGRRDFGTAVSGNSIYVIGGNIDEPRSVMKEVHRYDTTTGAWSQVASMNVGRRYPACGTPDNKPTWIASIGGIDNGGTNVVEAYNTQSNVWYRNPTTPARTFRNGQIAFINPYWYLLCGAQNGNTTNGVMRLDTRVQPNGQWVADAPSPGNKRVDFGAAVLGGRIYLVGGINDVNQRVGVVDVATAVPVGAMVRASALHQSMNFSEDE